MNPVLFIQLTVLLISLVLGIIFFVAWRTMGRQKYILIWTGTFFVMVIQRLLNVFSEHIEPRALYWIVVCGLSMLSTVLGTWGHMLRIRSSVGARALFAFGFLGLAVTFYFTVVDVHVGLSESLYIYHNAVLLTLVGVVLLRYRRRPSAAEIGCSVSYLMLASFQIVAGTFALLQGAELNPTLRELYLIINFVTMPATFTAMGLFTVFILATDLSERMKTLAMTDPLTSSLNRRGFYDQAKSRIKDLTRGSQHICLIYFDIDNFKSINDQYGHAAGDQVLIETVQRVRAHIKGEDLLGRIGGEEFVVLLGRTELDDATQVAERLRSVIEAKAFGFADRRIEVTASFGVVVLNEHRCELEQAIDTADNALYRAKQEGRNQVVLAT